MAQPPCGTALRANRDRLDAIAEQLLIHETLDEPDVYAAAGINRRVEEPAPAPASR